MWITQTLNRRLRYTACTKLVPVPEGAQNSKGCTSLWEVEFMDLLIWPRGCMSPKYIKGAKVIKYSNARGKKNETMEYKRRSNKRSS